MKFVRRSLRGGQSGYSLAELIMVCTLMLILAGVATPVVKFTHKRAKEAELREALRTLRNAIDEYKRYSDAGLLPIELGTDGYPSDFDVMLEGIELVGQVDMNVKFLRRIPVDPMTGEDEWGKRSYQDDVDSSSWGGENLFDVYSLSQGVGLNGVPYTEW